MWKYLLAISIVSLSVVGKAALFSGAPVVGSFQGNPNVTITSITASIAASRTTCQTPCFVQVSASPTTASGTSVPYEDLEYQWNFGNASGTEIFNQPLDLNGKSYNPQPVNANNSQWGPEAAYVFRSAGTYTVTLSSRGKNGTSFVIGSVTQTITVTTFNPSAGEWYFDSAAAGGGSGTIGSPFNDLATLNTKASISNTAIHIKRGSSWSSATGISITDATNAVRIDAYGSGAVPIIDLNSGSNKALFMTNGGSSDPQSKSDIVFSNITLSQSGTNTAQTVASIVTTGNDIATFNNIYLDNIVITTNLNITDLNVVDMNDHRSSLLNLGTNYGLWNVAISSPIVGGLGNGLGFFGGPKDWFFIVGGSFIGAGTNATLDHHIYPNVKTHSLYRFINFGNGPTKNYNINTNWNGAGGLEFVDYILMSDNYFSGTLRSFDAGNANNDISLTQYRNFVAQRNAFTALTGDGVISPSCMVSFTLRDNLIWGVDGGRFYAPASTTAPLLYDRIYRNLAYRTGGQNNGMFYSWTGAAFTGGTRTFTNNVTQDTEATAKAITLIWADVQVGSVINSNQWYAPNDSDASYFYDNATAKTFAQWQAAGFDAAGSVANPAWVDPANGNFNQ